jgi:hypothetical protein
MSPLFPTAQVEERDQKPICFRTSTQLVANGSSAYCGVRTQEPPARRAAQSIFPRSYLPPKNLPVTAVS